MKSIRILSVVAVIGSLVAAPLAGFAADPKKSDVKPYKLETCAVSDEKLGEMGKPFVFEHKGQEIKLCCKSCKKDFDKTPDKFLKKMAENEKKAAAKPAAPAKPVDPHAGHNH
ncbi:MAG: hypothetical protein H7Y43_04200 [Akkermansiaceae bacterium]|nr:hypothetical protein [Verrucomicrobiales bacterium]